jgi:ribosome biogenesis GTPase
MSELSKGLVISHLGQGIAVEISGSIILCQTRRKVETVAVGDQVMVTLSPPDQGRIEEILPRHSLLERPSRNKKTRPVAANIDKIYVVFATEPHCDFLLIDQYLAICENKNIDAVLVLNKIDLTNLDVVKEELDRYQALGYELHKVSASENLGIDTLKAALKDQISIFAGQSGVGKSSLTNAIIPDKQLKTNTVSEITKHGRHTTTAATLYHLPEGGDLIDSPGVAIFGLADLSEQQLAWGYREFQPLLDHCKFHNCRHLKDKGCAVRAAAESGDISMQRYQRFLKLREKMPSVN